MTTIQAQPGKTKKLIAWNGIQMHIPADWEVSVSGPQHLIFEKDFAPLIQIRWENPANQTPHYSEEQLANIASRMGAIISDNDFPPALQQVKDIFVQMICYKDEGGMVGGAILLCANTQTLILLQLLVPARSILQEVSDCLATLSCRKNTETMWRMQDFSLITPLSFLLKDYTFGAGLTRLSFYSSDLLLQTCKLAPADIRLERQSLAEILITLANTSDLDIVTTKDNISCAGSRTPAIIKQVFFRLRREKPFVRAKIWHNTVANRLLAIVLSSNRPISQSITDQICRHYEIIQK